MKHRSPIAVFLLPFITFGIYALVWEVKTKEEMKRLGADIPTAWLLIVPIVNYWWLWKYSEGVDKTTGGKLSAPISFILLLLLSTIGMAIIQNEFNKVGDNPVGQPPQPVTPATPENFTPPQPPTIAPTA